MTNSKSNSRLDSLARVIFVPAIFLLWLVGYEKYVGEDSFKDYWRNF